MTVYDEEDFEFVKSFLAFRDSSHVATWLGLHKTKKNISWSNDTPFNSTMFTENGTQSQICVAINGTTWNHFNCAERKPFMCHIGKIIICFFLLVSKENKHYISQQKQSRGSAAILVAV